MVSILVDQDIQLRSFTVEDAPVLFETIETSRSFLRPWMKWVDHTTRVDEVAQFIQGAQSRLHQQEGLELGIFRHQQILGGMGMHNWDHSTKKAQMGYWLRPAVEGEGLAYRCGLRFLQFLFEKPGLNKIEIHFMARNHRSAALAKRLGFQIEGVIRQSYLIHGQLEDIVITGLLKSEWKQQQTAILP